MPSVDVVLVDPAAPLPAVACDWDGDGGDTLATVAAGRWVVGDGRGIAHYADSVVFGRAAGDVPLCGDWDGDGDDEPGVSRSGTFHLRSDLTASAVVTVASIGRPGDVPVVGDWDGDGVDTPGVLHGDRRLLAGRADGGDLERGDGPRLEPGDRVVVGDWDGDALDTIAVVRGDRWSTGPGSPTDRPTHLGGPGPGGVALAVAIPGGGDRPTVVRPGPERADAVSIAVFGDSLASESQAAFRQAISTGRDRHVEVAYASYGGTAVCDYHEEIARAATGARPDLVVLSFSGNNVTRCTLLEPGEGACPSWVTDVEVWRQLESCRRRGADLFRQYLDDVRWAVASLGRIPVVLVAPPTMSDVATGANPKPGTGRTGWIWQAYREVAAEDPDVTLVDGGALLTPDDRWVERLPCLPGEDCPATAPGSTGPATAVVRSPDGIHLCSGPFAGVRTDGGCPAAMPGPYRFAAVTADAVAARLGL